MRVYLDVFCSCGYNDDTWTGNWADDATWHLDHSCFNCRVESDVNAGLFSASIRLDCYIKCNKCGNSWSYWIKYVSLGAGDTYYKYYSCCGKELKLRFSKEAF